VNATTVRVNKETVIRHAEQFGRYPEATHDRRPKLKFTPKPTEFEFSTAAIVVQDV
jgi:hypothetical protein